MSQSPHMREEGERAERCVAYRVRWWKPLRRWLRLRQVGLSRPTRRGHRTHGVPHAMYRGYRGMYRDVVYRAHVRTVTIAYWSIVHECVDRGDAKHVSPRGLSRE